MKISTLSKIAGASVLALSLTTLPASAQTNTTPGTTSGTTTDNTQTTGTDATTTTTNGDRDFDWGWLGLIGLAGLAGLAGKRREEPTRYREPDNVSTTGYRE